MGNFKKKLKGYGIPNLPFLWGLSGTYNKGLHDMHCEKSLGKVDLP